MELLERGEVRARRARAMVARLPRHIAERELAVIPQRLGWSGAELAVEEIADAHGMGNVLTLEVECEHVTEVFTAFGERGVRAESVAEGAAREAQAYLAAPGVPVGAHLADQLLVPMAMAGAGRFRTLEPTLHTRTNAEVVEKFLDVKVTMRETAHDDCEIGIQAR